MMAENFLFLNTEMNWKEKNMSNYLGGKKKAHSENGG